MTPQPLFQASSAVQVSIADLSTLRSYLLNLFCEGAYREGDFVLSSGQRSHYYINGKQVTLHPLGGLAIGRVLLSLIDPSISAVAGLTLGADPLVTATSVVAAYEGRSLTPLIVRKEPKGHGTQAYIEGLTLATGSAVVVLEDVVTTGQSALKAVERLRMAGYTVERIIAVVDRHQGGAELYQAEGLSFETVFSIGDIQARWAERQA